MDRHIGARLILTDMQTGEVKSSGPIYVHGERPPEADIRVRYGRHKGRTLGEAAFWDYEHVTRWAVCSPSQRWRAACRKVLLYTSGPEYMGWMADHMDGADHPDPRYRARRH